MRELKDSPRIKPSNPRPNPFQKEQALFSICTPIYKVTYKHLEQCARALNEQEYKRFEWIVVFDGKHKQGEKTMKKIIKKYSDMDISYYTIEHAGACAARNHAYEKAKGEFMAFPGGDCYLYPEAIRIWANAFEENPELNRVWGMYDLIDEQGNTKHPIGNAPVLPNGDVYYEAFKHSPYCDGTFPFRRSDFVKWDEDCDSLQDWEISLRMLKRDNYKGKDWKYIHHSFFSAELPKPGGLSDDSHQNWKERREYVRTKNGVSSSDIVVSSLGAPVHGFHVARKLNAEYLQMPSFKPHNYNLVYLLGFYTKENPESPYVTKSHMDVFEGNKGTNIIHWIGSDILQLQWNCSFMKIKELKKWFKEKKIIHLAEAPHTQKELKEMGIDAKIVPLPPEKLYEPMDLPEEFSVGVYLPASEIYKHQLVMEVINAMPDVKFYLFGDKDRKGEKGKNWEQLGWIDLEKEMPKFSVNLRVTVHDGLPLTPLQFISAGRNVVTNIPLKGTIQVEKTRESIVKGIRKAQKEPISDKTIKYWNKELSTEKFVKSIRRYK